MPSSSSSSHHGSDVRWGREENEVTEWQQRRGDLNFFSHKVTVQFNSTSNFSHFGLLVHRVFLLLPVLMGSVICRWEVKTLRNGFLFQTISSSKKWFLKWWLCLFKYVKWTWLRVCQPSVSTWSLGMNMREGACPVGELVALLYNAGSVHLAQDDGTEPDYGKLALC